MMRQSWEGVWWRLRALLTTSLAELSLTVPITNSLAFLFTVLGEWWAEGKVISRGVFALHQFKGGALVLVLFADDCEIDTWIGMAFVLGGIALCVQSKNT